MDLLHSAERSRPKGLLIDFGGVLTVSVLDVFTAACESLGVDGPGFLRDCFSSAHPEDSPFVALELGKISTDEFGELLTPVLRRHAQSPVDGREWYSAVESVTWNLDDAMVNSTAALIDSGVPTALVSNSWGPTYTYPWDSLPRFTEIVVSRDVGMRKPDPAIYELAAQRLGMHPSDCVFVDDLQVNLETATKLGMATVLHEDAAQTIGQLRNIFADRDRTPAGP